MPFILLLILRYYDGFGMMPLRAIVTPPYHMATTTATTTIDRLPVPPNGWRSRQQHYHHHIANERHARRMAAPRGKRRAPGAMPRRRAAYAARGVRVVCRCVAALLLLCAELLGHTATLHLGISL